MRCYKVSVEVGVDEPVTVARYAGTQAQAKAARDALVLEYGVRKSDIETEEVDVPTSKEGLLAFINGLAK